MTIVITGQHRVRGHAFRVKHHLVGEVDAIPGLIAESEERGREDVIEKLVKKAANMYPCGDCINGIAEGSNDPDQPRFCGCIRGHLRAAIMEVRK